MPFFKKKSDQPNRASRIEELEAHVRAIRQGSRPNSGEFNSLEAFLMEDQWPGQQQAAAPAKPPPPSVAKAAATPAPAQPQSEGAGLNNEEAMLIAELERYLAQHPEGSDDSEDSPSY